MDWALNELFYIAEQTITVIQHTDTDVDYVLLRYKTQSGFVTTSKELAIMVAVNDIIYPKIRKYVQQKQPGGE